MTDTPPSPDDRQPQDSDDLRSPTTFGSQPGNPHPDAPDDRLQDMNPEQQPGIPDEPASPAEGGD